MSGLNPVSIPVDTQPESYSHTVIGTTNITLPPVSYEDGFPRFTRGEFSGAVFLMITPTFGYSITDGTNCFLPLGEVVRSMQSMVPYHGEENYEEHLAHHVGIYQKLYAAHYGLDTPAPVDTETERPVAA